MSVEDLDLLRQFTREQSQDAFTVLVKRHLDLVYSAALRQVRSPELAEEVSQTVFTHLARDAAKLRPNTNLTAWLYQVTHHTAVDVVRRESRRQAREQIAFQMSDPNEPSAEWSRIEPLLDEAMQSLDEADRTAILLRFFENKSLREVGEVLGASEDAAQKRVQRAIERLREVLGKREITVGASGLTALVSAHAIHAAPAGLAAAIASSTALSSIAIAGTTAITLTKAVAMTTIQKTIITVLIVGGIATSIYQTRQVSTLRNQVKALQDQSAQQAALSNKVGDLQRERDRATNRLAELAGDNTAIKKNPNEVLKLRGEVGRLRQENATLGSTNAISKITANPEARKLMRSQQKMGMGILYKDFAKQLSLSSEQTDKLNDLLADHIMDNVGNVTVALRDKLSPAQMDELFSSQDAVLQEKIQTLLGPDSMEKYQDYSRNLLSTLSADQFKASLSGDEQAKKEKGVQFSQAMHEAVQAVLASAGLPADYQPLPILNFRNIASEAEAERNLKLLDDIYQQAAARSTAFLTADELKKLQEFRTTAISNNRSILTINRTVMAPISQ
jgi:RNA polymerase sigma factor (sigma-70 family)